MGIKKIMQSFIREFGYEIVKRKRLDKRYMPFFDGTKPSSDKFTQEVTQTILNFFDEVDPMYADVRGPLAIGGAWREDLILRRKNQLRILKDRREEYEYEYEQLLLNMFRNELISGLWNYGYYPACRRKVLHNQFLDALKGFEYVTGRDSDELCQNGFLGNPWGYKTECGIVKYTDPWHGVQADSVVNLLNLLISKDDALYLTVVDLGSGFGGTIEKIARWHNFPTRYILVDIPLNLTTAYAYISYCFPNSEKHLITNSTMLTESVDRSTYNTEFIFVPTFLVEELKTIEINVLLNAGSLSEMDFETIEFYLKTLVTENTIFFIEWNSNSETLNTGGHIEVPLSEFPVPNTHKLLLRSPAVYSVANRYLNSLWVNSRLFQNLGIE